jgi:hypothetical protein
MSEEGCKNGCVLPLSFPRRPGKNPPSPHGEGCFCCTPETRVSSDNRPALPHFNYRIGSYGTIREWLINRMDQTASLRNWTHRTPDDPAIALLEGASILGDILTFYQETYANEAFLRTAKGRESISDLVRLLGYRLSPAVGGNAVFAFEIKKDEPVVIPAGFPLKAELDDLPKPSEFETKEEITAYPWLSRFNLYRPLAQPDIGAATTEFYISVPDQSTSFVDLKVGDRLLIGKTVNFPPNDGLFTEDEVVIIDSVREQHGQKIYKIKGNLKRVTNISGLTAYRLGRSFHHFGYNSPRSVVNASAQVISTATVDDKTKTTTTTSQVFYLEVPAARPVRNAAGYFTDPAISLKGIRDTDFPLDSEVKDLPGKTKVLLQAEFFSPAGSSRALRTIFCSVVDIKPVTLTWGGISGSVSQLQLFNTLDTFFNVGFFIDITTALFHEVTSPALTIKAVKIEPISPDKGNTLDFYGPAEHAGTLPGRSIMFDYPGQEPRIVTVNQVTAKSAQLYGLTLSEDVPYGSFPNENPVVPVFGNLANADEGKTLPEAALGSGNATLVFQNFKVPKAPLTYHVVPANTPTETPEAEIYVDGRLWTKVDSFFGRGPEEKIYIVREDAEGNSWVQFGDGKTGARLTSGVQNVTAVYRTGSGSFGNLKEDTKVQASAKLKNLDKIGMPILSSGGSQPEDGDNARSAAPGKVQSLGRIVSLNDFESEALAVPGVVAAAAAWQLVEHAPGVVITVLMETGRSAEMGAVSDTLRSYNTLRGPGRFRVEASLGKRMYVAAWVEYALRPGFRADLVEPQIRRALGVNYALATVKEDQTGLFSLRRRRFGGHEYASSIEGVTQNVEGVLWAKVAAFKELTTDDDPEVISVIKPAVLDPMVSCDASNILSLYDKHLFLTPVKGAS